MRMNWKALALACGVGCSDGATGLGVASGRDAGRDASPATVIMCGAASVRPGLQFEADATARATVRSGAPVTQRTGQTLRPGSATIIGSDVHWAVADDRCGRSGLGMWWGAVVGRLSFDPDQRITSNWLCLPDTWAALHLTPVRVGDSLGVFFARHTALDRARNMWLPLGAVSGAVDLDRRVFETTWDVNDVALAKIAPDTDGFDVIFTRDGRRFYQRLDGRLQTAGDEVNLGAEQSPGHDVPLFLLPRREALRSFWSIYPDARQDVEVTTYTRVGETSGSWTMLARIGVERHLRTLAAVPVDGGFVGVVSTGEEGRSETWLARFCDDGAWSMRRFTREALEASLLRQGDHWVVLLSRPLDGGAEQVIEAHVLDDDGRRMAPAREIDAGRLGEVGDLVVAPGTRDLAALYVLYPSGGNAHQARAARVTVTP
jgi:hypothetical protein